MIAALLTKLCPSIYRWAVYGAVALAVLGAVAGKSYLAGDDHGQGVARATDAKDQARVYAAFEANLQEGVKLAGELQSEQATSSTRIKTLLREISDAKTLTVPAPAGSTAEPELTAHAVSLFDSAWSGVELSGGPAAAGADAGAALAGPDDESASGFYIRDALYSDGVNAGRCWAWILELQQLHRYERDRAARAGKP